MYFNASKMVQFDINQFQKFTAIYDFTKGLTFIDDLVDNGYVSACILETIDDRWFALSEEDYVRFVLTWG